jgi:hypothetical protein
MGVVQALVVELDDDVSRAKTGTLGRPSAGE